MDKISNLPVFEDVEFSKHKPERISYGFFTRQGGVSGDVYNSLNCGPGSGDNSGDVRENRARVASNFGVDSDHLLSLYQVHGRTCVYVKKPWAYDNRPEADSFVTDQPGIALGILTADCTPVLFYGETSQSDPIIGAAHAGWGGAFKGVLESTIEEMVKLGADINTIRACIGPCIQKRSYEVSNEFMERFIDSDPEYERFFIDGQRPGHPHFDLSGFCAARLYATGIKHIYISDHDTYTREEEYFSYRRKTHRDESDYGRQISAIMIKPVKKD